MMNPASGPDVTVRDVLNGLEAMEKWTRQLREALATLDQEQRLDIRPVLLQGPRVRAGQCPPPDGKPKKRKKPGTTKKKNKK